MQKKFLNMGVNGNDMEEAERRAKEAEETIGVLKLHLQFLQKIAAQKQTPGIQEQVSALSKENEKLREEAAKLKRELTYWEIRNGMSQVPFPTKKTSGVVKSESDSKQPIPVTSATAIQSGKLDQPTDAKLQKKKEKKEKKPQKEKSAVAKVDVSRLDFRVGKILSVKLHPDADTLYVEEVDIGEEGGPRTVCSGLVQSIPMEQLQDRMVVMMCNLKPVKMRGIVSQAMVMCACTPEKTEALDPPPGSSIGDRIVFEGYPGEPDALLNPKKKVWETVQPDLLTDDECVATYKGSPFMVLGKGVCKAQTLKRSPVK